VRCFELKLRSITKVKDWESSKILRLSLKSKAG
jgi:hypothetical protein